MDNNLHALDLHGLQLRNASFCVGLVLVFLHSLLRTTKSMVSARSMTL